MSTPESTYQFPPSCNPAPTVQVLGADGKVAIKIHAYGRIEFVEGDADIDELAKTWVAAIERIVGERTRLLVRVDSLMSLILQREASGLTEQTARELDELIGLVRAEIQAARFAPTLPRDA